jgi:opacity protein-like surface antigen
VINTSFITGILVTSIFITNVMITPEAFAAQAAIEETGTGQKSAEQSRNDDVIVVSIIDPFIELHTGPGRGYPIDHVCERGETVTILKQRTDWFKVMTEKGKMGWVKRRQMQRTLGLHNEEVDLQEPALTDFIKRRWELGVLAGDYDGDDALTLYGNLRFTENLAAEVKLQQATGNVSNKKIATLSVVHQPFPEWRISPFFTLGAGIITTEPKPTLVQTEDRTDSSLLVGVGAYYYISSRFMLRMEYSNHLILTSRNVNEEVHEWQAGFSVFF